MADVCQPVGIFSLKYYCYILYFAFSVAVVWPALGLFLLTSCGRRVPARGRLLQPAAFFVSSSAIRCLCLHAWFIYILWLFCDIVVINCYFCCISILWEFISIFWFPPLGFLVCIFFVLLTRFRFRFSQIRFPTLILWNKQWRKDQMFVHACSEESGL